MSDEPQAAAPETPRRPTKAERRAQSVQELKTDLKWATALLFVLVLAISGWMYPAWQGAAAGTEDLGEMADVIFSSGAYAEGARAEGAQTGASAPGLVAPFEILAVLLLAALVAAGLIAARDPERGP